MTGNDGRTGAPLGPPWSVEVLADLHAGALDEVTASRLHAEIRNDQDAQAVLAALEATTTDLGALGRVPAPRMPDAVASRIDAALANERAAHAPQQLAPVVDLAERRRRRGKIAGWGIGVVAAAAAVAAIVTTALPNTIDGTPTGNLAEPPQQEQPGEQPLALGSSSTLDAAVANKAVGRTEYGPLQDTGRRTGCLAANNASGQQVIGARQVTLDGRDGVLFVLTTGEAGTFRLLAVEPACAAGSPATIADKTVG